MAQLNFDATQVQPNAGIADPVPADWYDVMFDESEMKPTKAGDGAYLQLRANIITGQYANRKLWVRLNLQNANQQAVDIAYADLSAICHAVGVMHLQDSQQLHGIPLKVKVKLRPADDNYDASNEVVSFKNINENVGGATGGAQGGGQPDWANAQGGGQANTAPQANTQPAQTNTAPQGQQQWQQGQQGQQPWQGGQQQEQAPQGQQQQWQQGGQVNTGNQNVQQEQAPQQQQQQNTSPSVGGDGVPPWQQGGQG